MYYTPGANGRMGEWGKCVTNADISSEVGLCGYHSNHLHVILLL